MFRKSRPCTETIKTLRTSKVGTSVLSAYLAAFFGIFCSDIGTVSAHPLDVSATSMTVEGNSAVATTALHPSEVERILGKRGVPMRSITFGDYYGKKDYVFDYLRDHVKVSVDGKSCVIGGFSTREMEVDEIFAEGFPVSYSFSCTDKITKLDVSISIFDELPLQTNRLTLIGAGGTTLAYKVLTPVLPDLEYDLSAGTSAKALDTDGDGLSDEEEKAYRTDPKNPDTDGDFYTDGEEVMWGWNPLSKELSPGQKYREAPVSAVLPGEASAPSGLAGANGVSGLATPPVSVPGTPGSNSSAPSKGSDSARFQAPVSLLDSSVYGADFFRKVLKGVTKFVGSPTAPDFWSLFALTAALGFVHAAGPGHAKTLLAASVLDRRRGYFSGLAFALVFTVTHLADVAILVLLTKYVFEAFDPGPYMLAVQRFGGFGLVGLSAYLCYRAYRDWNSAPAPETPFRKFPGWRDVLAGFFAGLAPCAFGWGIFLVLFSLGKIGWALPLLSALGIGIFACLTLVLTVTYFLREKAFFFAPGLVRRSSAVSAFAMSAVTVYALFLIW